MNILHSELPLNQTLLTEKQVAALLQVSVACLRRWRRLGQPPTFLKIGPSLVRYHTEDIAAYLQTAKKN